MKLSWNGSAWLVAAVIGAATGQQAALALAAQQAPAASQAPASPLAAISQDEAEAIILDRQLVMQQIDKDTKALGMIVAGSAPPDKLAERARSLAKGTREALKAFEANTPGGASKPEVWTNWADFSKRMQDFAVKSEEMAKVSESGNLAVVGEHMIGALQCKQCHDVYRIRK